MPEYKPNILIRAFFWTIGLIEEHDPKTGRSWASLRRVVFAYWMLIECPRFMSNLIHYPEIMSDAAVGFFQHVLYCIAAIYLGGHVTGKMGNILEGLKK